MLRLLFTCAGCWVTALMLLAQDNKFASSSIADSLRNNANAVIREEFAEYTYLSSRKNTGKYRRVVTVLNKNGDKYATVVIPYDQFREVTNIRGNLYDADGKLIRKSKPSDIIDLPYSNMYLQFDDFRYKALNPLVSQYPYTLEVEYEVSYDGSYYFPDLFAPGGYNLATEKSTMKINTPVDYELYYRQFNLPSGQPTITAIETGKSYTWTVSNIKAVDSEPFSDDLFRYTPTVFTSPSFFSVGGFEGYNKTWNDFARWQAKVNQDRDVLPENRAREIQDMVKDITGDREKAKFLYKYMQSRMRYFGIQLGIGGFQPMEAAVVDELGYSDCKGLTNYMKTLLKAVGIISHYALVESGGDFPQVLPGLVYDPFDHIILCVPLRGDTVWLECTSQTIPFGFLGDFTSDRQALIVKDDGGELVRTPVYAADENYQHTTVRVSIATDGAGTADITRKFGGLQFDDNSEHLHEGPDDQRKWLYDYYNVPNFSLTTFSFVQYPEDQPESVLKSTLSLRQYASSSGKRLFLPLNLTNKSGYVPAKLTKRLTDIRRTWSYTDTDTIIYEIPGDMTVEFLPENKEIKTPFGEYTASAKQSGNTIVYTRQLKMYKGTYARELYDDFVKMFYDITVADKCQAILTKKEN